MINFYYFILFASILSTSNESDESVILKYKNSLKLAQDKLIYQIKEFEDEIRQILPTFYQLNDDNDAEMLFNDIDSKNLLKSECRVSQSTFFLESKSTYLNTDINTYLDVVVTNLQRFSKDDDRKMPFIAPLKFKMDSTRRDGRSIVECLNNFNLYLKIPPKNALMGISIIFITNLPISYNMRMYLTENLRMIIKNHSFTFLRTLKILVTVLKDSVHTTIIDTRTDENTENDKSNEKIRSILSKYKMESISDFEPYKNNLKEGFLNRKPEVTKKNGFCMKVQNYYIKNHFILTLYFLSITVYYEFQYNIECKSLYTKIKICNRIGYFPTILEFSLRDGILTPQLRLYVHKSINIGKSIYDKTALTDVIFLKMTIQEWWNIDVNLLCSLNFKHEEKYGLLNGYQINLKIESKKGIGLPKIYESLTKIMHIYNKSQGERKNLQILSISMGKYNRDGENGLYSDVLYKGNLKCGKRAILAIPIQGSSNWRRVIPSTYSDDSLKDYTCTDTKYICVNLKNGKNIVIFLDTLKDYNLFSENRFDIFVLKNWRKIKKLYMVHIMNLNLVRYIKEWIPLFVWEVIMREYSKVTGNIRMYSNRHDFVERMVYYYFRGSSKFEARAFLMHPWEHFLHFNYSHYYDNELYHYNSGFENENYSSEIPYLIEPKWVKKLLGNLYNEMIKFKSRLKTYKTINIISIVGHVIDEDISIYYLGKNLERELQDL